MPSIVPVFNNLFITKKPNLDKISKLFIYMQLLVGLNRISLLKECPKNYALYAICQAVFFCLISCYTVFSSNLILNRFFIASSYNIQYCLSLLISTMTWRRLSYYYTEINNFDTHVGCRPKAWRGSLTNIIQLIVMTVMNFIISIFTHAEKEIPVPTLKKMFSYVVYFLNVTEVHFYGHLMSLLTPRLRLLNIYIRAPLMKDQEKTLAELDRYVFFNQQLKHKSHCDMNKAMELYTHIMKAFYMIIEAIKWQMLTFLTTVFFINVNFSYKVSIDHITGKTTWFNTLPAVFSMLVVMLSLFSPCVLGDQLQKELRCLRELLSFRLYQRDLDKSNRRSARTLLALTEARDLSFSLHNMFKIDISFPFKFAGLVITYLIILLQFGKLLTT